jgi:hypothetical protein
VLGWSGKSFFMSLASAGAITGGATPLQYRCRLELARAETVSGLNASVPIPERWNRFSGKVVLTSVIDATKIIATK